MFYSVTICFKGFIAFDLEFLNLTHFHLNNYKHNNKHVDYMMDFLNTE